MDVLLLRNLLKIFTSLIVLNIIISLHGNVLCLAGPRFNVLNTTETEMHVHWSPIADPSLHVEKYQISAFPIETHGDINMIHRNQWTFYNTTTKSELLGLYPGTLYNVSLWAFTNKGLTDVSSQKIWTEIGAPDVPPPVDIVERKGKTMSVNLPVGTNTKGPITSYQVVVLEKSPIMYLTPEELGDFATSQSTGLPFYIAADLTPEAANETFEVGDARTYGNYYNAPLGEDKKYEILVGVVSTLNGVTKVTYSSLKPTESSHTMAQNSDQVRTSSMLSVALSAAIGVFGFLLVISVIVYILLRKRYGKRRPSDQLVLRVHGFEGEENGFLPGLHLDNDTDLSEYYDQLKEHYSQIPRNHIEVHQAVLGIGQFGEVREGVVQKHAESIPCLVQHTQAPSIVVEKEKRSLLQELDKMARIGIHPNVVEFLGACDERGILLVAVEHHSTSLRGMLLRSRQQQNGKINSLSESNLLRICADIAHGMAHLSNRGILHRHLSTRNVLMDPSSAPKIAHFGMGHYYPLGKKLLYTRWAAPEVLNSGTVSSKSDVWSFGVLLYEVFTLGGSPYIHVPVRDLSPRIMQGMRLPRPKGISDDLFQIMLQCWEVDPDERPSFVELSTMLQNMVPNAQDHVNLAEIADGKYEKFDPNAEDD